MKNSKFINLILFVMILSLLCMLYKLFTGIVSAADKNHFLYSVTLFLIDSFLLGIVGVLKNWRSLKDGKGVVLIRIAPGARPIYGLPAYLLLLLFASCVSGIGLLIYKILISLAYS